MIRNAIGAVLAVVGAAAVVWSPFHAWYDGRLGRHYGVDDLFGGITPDRADPWASLLLPLAFAALVALVGLVLRSRSAVALAGLVALGFTVLWMVRQGQDTGSLTVSGDGRGFGPGTGLALGGGLVLLLAAVVMAGRRHGRMLGGHEAGYASGTGRRHARRRAVPQDPAPGPGDPAYPGGPDDASAHRPQGPYQDPHHDPYEEQGPYQDHGPYRDPHPHQDQDPYRDQDPGPYRDQDPHRDPHAQDTRTYPPPQGRDDRPS
ncbi:hypothetical protein RND61_08690 [Streptomyces sp. TRM76323]|uniref:Integral membrane protein n=1 Tax=Streptomyces tamarix TaxID=3078565 RepID=A0ABU3QH96_9ACTN|nr:hypothetical protein [Streptomyces tamarix]MDT9682149.1 hypothetical protein [Streptomyces tamarix]